LSTTAVPSTFSIQDYLPDDEWSQLCELRVREPQAVQGEAERRRRRPVVAPDGRLTIIAADHPGRGNTVIGTDRLAMANRQELLARLLAVLDGGFDGVMATPDILEELLALSALRRAQGREPLLDGRLIIGCMQRGSVFEASYELDDRFTCISASGLARLRADGGKLMFRIDLEDIGSLNTLAGCAQALDELDAHGVTQFLEVMPVRRSGSTWVPTKETDLTARQLGIAAALGSSTKNRWIKIPFDERIAEVARATTLPILLLGGPAVGSPEPFYAEMREAMKAGPNIRGCMVGRNVTFPGDLHPREVAATVHEIVHAG
jgi:DhnA family fructose-bisphosphate aldolase class Ia